MPHLHQPWPQASAPADPSPADPSPADPSPADPVEADPAAAEEPTAATTTGPDRPRRSRRAFALLILGAVTVILGGFGIVATVHASSQPAGPQNTAIVDSSSTSAVRQQIDSAVQTIFSYRYTDTGATRQAAQRLLTGPAIKQYNSLFALVERQAPAQKLVVVTTVTNSGVELLTGNQARVLIFVNQQDTRSGTSQTSYGGAMLAVTAIRQSGQWKIENIDTFA